jgi:cardiolipin synthase
VFLAVALSSDDGVDGLSAVLFAVIGWADYLDGFAARLTGQYSRLGALLDPVVDRLLVISGMVVCWHFELLPRWAIALVIARELFMLALSRYGLRHGVALKINWPGRIGVAPTMGAPFFAMAGVHWLALIMLYSGLALALLATVLYVRDGLRQTRARKASSSA